ncbi:uncharacterized protein LOC129217170 [Uloborus diversus]|uniref:uncharacterized protein LOC129217170 n=1 Tax=Uloborus diversus TaxID=327109 RepID=UPI0024090109|nr:uncharacterized protein LOC129217170 [Uloborus diversus]
MFTFEYNTWNSILHEYYILSLLISVLAVVVTFIVSRKANFLATIKDKIEVSPQVEEKTSMDEAEEDTTEVPTVNMKRSPALVAEKVIQANMTEEQKLLEHQVRQKQLAQIYELMLKQSDKFGSISLSEVEEQMKLYQ